MAEPHEPSYYEIALTNRQVVVAFVILLTCILTAFFSGVWVGRESTARAAQEQIVRNTPPEVAQEGKNLEELEFFDSKGKKGKDDRNSGRRQEATAAPSAGTTTLREDFGGKQQPAAQTPPEPAPPVRERQPPPEQVRPAQPAQEVVSAPLPDPAQERRNRRKARNAAAEAAAATPTAETSTPAAGKEGKAARNAAASPTVAKGSYVIQVFSSPDQAQAERIRTQLTGGGQKAYLSPISRGGRTMYRVRIGPFKTRGDAQVVADKVRKGYKLDTWVTE